MNASRTAMLASTGLLTVEILRTGDYTVLQERVVATAGVRWTHFIALCCEATAPSTQIGAGERVVHVRSCYPRIVTLVTVHIGLQ